MVDAINHPQKFDTLTNLCIYFKFKVLSQLDITVQQREYDINFNGHAYS